ncbi:unnamed protein product, partial [Chrysoparadoxa australica]
MKKLFLLFIASLIASDIMCQSELITSGIFDWEDISKGKNQTVFEGTSDGFDYLKISVVKLSKKKSYVVPPKILETLIIMKSGKVTQNAGNRQAVLGIGSI